VEIYARQCNRDCFLNFVQQGEGSLDHQSMKSIEPPTVSAPWKGIPHRGKEGIMLGR
jgi:hypothetical protein